MITSENGRSLLRTITPIYEQNKTMLSVFQAIGQEHELTIEKINDVQLQLYPQTATWGLRFWEEAVRIPTNESLTLEERRIRVLSKMQTRWPITKNRLEAIVNNFVASKNAYIEQFHSEYMFKINIPLTDEKIYYKDLIETVEEIKPAHLAYSIEGIAGDSNVTVLQRWAHNFINYLICGTFYPRDDEYWIGKSFNRKLAIQSTLYSFDVDYLICGTFSVSDQEMAGRAINRNVAIESNMYNFDVKYPICGTFNAGEVF